MTQTNPQLIPQEPSYYSSVATLYIQYLLSLKYTDDIQEKLLQGFYINHKKERENEVLSEEEEQALSNSWGTPYDIRNCVFIKRMKAKFSPQLLIWVNSQIMGNNLAADTYLTLLGIEFYKSHKFGDTVSLKWLDNIGVRGKLPDNEALYKFSRALLVGKKSVPIGESNASCEIQDMYYWDIIKRSDLYVIK